METPQRLTLGRLLRHWRERKNWTLKEMSSRTSIPVSTLSKGERDRLTLTYDKRMIPMVVHIRPRSLAEFGDLLRHCGEEYVYVLTGAVTVHTDFYEPVVLSAGESIYVDSAMGHAYTAEGCAEATVLAVCSSACGSSASAQAHQHAP